MRQTTGTLQEGGADDVGGDISGDLVGVQTEHRSATTVEARSRGVTPIGGRPLGQPARTNPRLAFEIPRHPHLPAQKPGWFNMGGDPNGIARLVNRTVSMVLAAGYDRADAMDEAAKKRMRNEARERERQVALRALPLPIVELEAMFEALDAELSATGCDHSRRHTLAWLVARGHAPANVFPWLDEHGGYCDCEVLANVPDEVEETKKASEPAGLIC